MRALKVAPGFLALTVGVSLLEVATEALVIFLVLLGAWALVQWLSSARPDLLGASGDGLGGDGR